jgi:hypothetical protein
MSIFHYNVADEIDYIDQYEVQPALIPLPEAWPDPAGYEHISRLYIDLTGLETGEKGRAIGSVSADGKNLSKFVYNGAGDLTSIDQYDLTSPFSTLPISWPTTGGATLASRIFMI